MSHLIYLPLLVFACATVFTTNAVSAICDYSVKIFAAGYAFFFAVLAIPFFIPIS